MSWYLHIVGVEKNDDPIDWTQLDDKKPYTEAELLQMPLHPEEIPRRPEFRNAFDQFVQAFTYPFYGTYYTFKKVLFPYLVVEIVFYVLFMICCYPWMYVLILRLDKWILKTVIPSLGYDIQKWIVKITGPVTTVFIVLWIVNQLFMLVFHYGFMRVSNICEQKMKGNRSRYGLCYCYDLGMTINWCHYIFCFIICEGIAFLFRRLLITFVLLVMLPVLGALVNLIPLFGQVAYIVLLVFFLSFYLGILSFESGVLRRKCFTSMEMFHYHVTHIMYIAGYGAGTLVLYFIPLANIFHYFYGVVGATRLYCHVHSVEKKWEIWNAKTDKELKRKLEMAYHYDDELKRDVGTGTDEEFGFLDFDNIIEQQGKKKKKNIEDEEEGEEHEEEDIHVSENVQNVEVQKQNVDEEEKNSSGNDEGFGEENNVVE